MAMKQQIAEIGLLVPVGVGLTFVHDLDRTRSRRYGPPAIEKKNRVGNHLYLFVSQYSR
jgi:hypothetical protein